KTTVILISAFCLAFSFSAIIRTEENEKQRKPYNYFDNPQVCAGCHWEKFARWNVSQHSKAFTGDFFQKQYYNIVLPSRNLDKRLATVNEGCIGCHSPSSWLANDMIPQQAKELDNHWNRGTGYKTLANRGVFCDFCHTLDGFKNDPPFNHDYISTATAEVDPKRGDLPFPWSPFHTTKRSEIYEDPMICATCHNELNPYDVWVKATEIEYTESEYPARGIVCQTCHLQTMGGKPAKMGPIRPHNSDHWFGGGFSEFVEGAAKVKIINDTDKITPGRELSFNVLVHGTATGHKFPTGSVEERDVWLHVTVHDDNGNEIAHIPIPKNPDDPNDKYFITSNEKVAYPSHSSISKPFERDSLPEGDRLYHSAFIDSKGQFTYAQWLAVEEIENRLEPNEEREEHFKWTVPSDFRGEIVYLRSVLFYRRMPDSFADFLNIDRRPVIEVSRDEMKLTLSTL
ncbi:multiheme c-type cytochrome, partial [Candidatus Omnitrophota bacterium]